MAVIQFNNGNPFAVGPAGVHSASRTLPTRVATITLQITDPVGDWVAPANAGGTFTYGIEYSIDGEVNWKTLAGSTQTVGTLFHGTLPHCGVVGDDLVEARGMPCRAFGSCSSTITIGATATIT